MAKNGAAELKSGAGEAPSNLVSRSMMFALMREEARLEGALKTARAALGGHRKRVKSYGLKVRNYLAIYQLFNSSDGGDEYLQDLREQKRMISLLDLPAGHQFSLLDDVDIEVRAAQRQDDPKAYKAGVRAYIAGEAEKECPHAANTVEGQEWLEGYRMAERLCAEGKKDLDAMDAGKPDRGEAARGTLPADPPKKRGRPRKHKPDEAHG